MGSRYILLNNSSGSFSYAAVVVVVNVKILASTNTHTVWSFLWIILSIVSFFVALMIMSVFTLLDLYATLGRMVSNSHFYLGIFLLSSAIILIDVAFHRTRRLIITLRRPDKLRQDTLMRGAQFEEEGERLSVATIAMPRIYFF